MQQMPTRVHWAAALQVAVRWCGSAGARTVWGWLWQRTDGAAAMAFVVRPCHDCAAVNRMLPARVLDIDAAGCGI